MTYDGKTYRNLEGQVKYLGEVAEALDNRITEVAANIPSKMVVEELPEEGDPKITYYVGPKGTEPNLYYEVWVWVQEEEDGPFVWRELEDTDQVDLSGYLQKDETPASPYNRKVYGVNDSGEQIMITVSGASTAGNIPVYVGTGQLNVVAPTLDTQATNKKYVDDGFVAKDTSVTSYQKVYAKTAGGEQTMLSVSTGAVAGNIVQRDSSGDIQLRSDFGVTPPGDNDAISKKYATDNFLPKTTTTGNLRLYGISTDGTQLIFNVAAQPYAYYVAYRGANGQLSLPNQLDYTPSDDQAVSKRYVNALVGQLLYLHEIKLTYSLVDGSNDLEVLAYLINDDSTAITTLSQDDYKRMSIEYGKFGSTSVSVLKYPEYWHQEFDEPQNNKVMYQYLSGASVVAGAADSNTYTMTVTDVVVSF